MAEASPPAREYTEAEPRYSSECTGGWYPRVEDMPCGKGTFLDYTMPSPDGYLDGIVRYRFPDGSIGAYHIYASKFCPPGTSFGSSGFCEGPVLNPAPPPKQQGIPTAGGCLAPWSIVGDPVIAVTGNLFHEESDWRGAGVGALTLTRSYNSWAGLSAHQYGFGLAAYRSPFGVGWSFTYGGALFANSMPPLRSVKVLRPDGRVLIFEQRNGNWQSDGDVVEQLSARLGPSGRLVGWTLVTAEASTETYDEQGRLLEIMDRGGLQTRLAYGSAPKLDGLGRPGAPLEVTDAFGRTIAFTYDAQGHIVRANFPGGAVQHYAYDDHNRLATTTRPDGTPRGYRYGEGPLGRLQAIVGANGQDLETFAYDATGRTTDAARQGGLDAVSLRYTPGATELTTGLGASILVAHEEIAGAERSRLVRTPCPGCATPYTEARFEYDPDGLMTSRLETPGDASEAQNTRFKLDAARQLVVQRVDALGSKVERSTHFEWHPHWRLPSEILRGTHRLRFTYDERSNLRTFVDADLAHGVDRKTDMHHIYSETSRGAVLHKIVRGPRDDVEQVQRIEFWPPNVQCPGKDPFGCRGRPSLIIDPLGHTAKFLDYNAAGLPLAGQSADGRTLAFRYDMRNRVTRVTLAAEEVLYAYDAEGNVAEVTQADGIKLRFAWDAARRVAEIRFADGSRIAYLRNATGEVTEERRFDANGTSIRRHAFAYDALGRLVQDIGADGHAVHLAYDAHDNIIRRDGTRTDRVQVATYSHDALNRLIGATEADGGAAAVRYDAQDSVTAITDPAQQATQYDRDAWGNPLLTLSADTGTTRARFDAAGNLVESEDALGQVTRRLYDALNRPVAQHSSVAGTPSYAFLYDSCPNGIDRLCAVQQNGLTVTEFAYDTQGRLAGRSDKFGASTLQTRYEHGSGGRLQSLTYPSGLRVRYAFDAFGRVSRIELLGPGDKATVLASDFEGSLATGTARFTYGNGLKRALSFDADGRVTRIEDGPWARTVRYDLAGNPTRWVSEHAGTEQAVYDAVDRLISLHSPTALGILAYTYDPNGNRTSLSRDGLMQPYRYAPPNWLADSGTGERQRDAAGNAARMPALGTLHYDGYQRLIGFSADSSVTYGYDAFGVRNTKQVGDALTYFIHGTYDELLEEREAGGITHDYVYFEGRPIVRLDTDPEIQPQIYYLHADALGTTQSITNAQRDVVWAATFEPFGKARLTTERITNNLRLPGQYFDAETGLHSNVRRSYDPASGRYIQADPMGLAAGMNLYVYAGDNPLSRTDPMGLAYFAYRPLSGLPWLGPLSDNPLDDAMNTAISHEQIFFEDGKVPANIGFFSDGELKTESNPQGYRPIPGHSDDCIMRLAVKNVKTGNYHLIGNNCQNWASNVREEYNRLLNNPLATFSCHK